MIRVDPELVIRYSSYPKYELDDGSFAVIYSVSGWFSRHNIPELMFNPTIVKHVLSGAYNPDIILDICCRSHGVDNDYTGIRDLGVRFVAPRSRFFIYSDFRGVEEVITDADLENVWIRF